MLGDRREPARAASGNGRSDRQRLRLIKVTPSRRTLSIFLTLVTVLITASTLDSIYPGYPGTIIAALVFLPAMGSIPVLLFRSAIALADEDKRKSANYVKLAIRLILLLFICGRAGAYVHLALYYRTYAKIIAATDVPRTVRFNWGDSALWVTDGLQATTLVYDEADALAGNRGETLRSDSRFEIEIQHLIGHFYLEHTSSR